MSVVYQEPKTETYNIFRDKGQSYYDDLIFFYKRTCARNTIKVFYNMLNLTSRMMTSRVLELNCA